MYTGNQSMVNPIMLSNGRASTGEIDDTTVLNGSRSNIPRDGTKNSREGGNSN
jgi:hypothetical protein